MPLKPLLPRLTLYTGGKECSLCEVAKKELHSLRQSSPFELSYFNIRDPPVGTDAKEAKKWRRLYQYEIPVLHLDDKYLQKHRIDTPGLIEALKGCFKPYHTVLAFASAPNRRGPPAPKVEEKSPSKSSRSTPPWRSPLAQPFFTLDSQFGRIYGEDISLDESEIYADLIYRAFAAFSSECVGQGVTFEETRSLDGDKSYGRPLFGQGELEDSQNVPGVEENHGKTAKNAWGIDETAQWGWIPGDKEVLYDSALSLEVAETPSRPSRSKPQRFACWNCQSPEHQLASCPERRNPTQIAASRIAFHKIQDTPPQHHLDFLRSYRNTNEERARRLGLVDQFRPGMQLSEGLLDALYYLEPRIATRIDEDGREILDGPLGDGEEEQEIKIVDEEKIILDRRRHDGDHLWLNYIYRWGYPPGYIGAKDPIAEARRRILIDPIHDEGDNYEFDDSEDDLAVFGDTLNDPTLPLPPPSPPPLPDTPPPPPTGPAALRWKRPWWELPPPPRLPWPIPKQRWVDYPTQKFSSQMLTPFDVIRQETIGSLASGSRYTMHKNAQ